MTEEAITPIIEDALQGNALARTFVVRLRTIMRQLDEDSGAELVNEMMNHLISLNRGKKMDRYAAVALMLLVAANSVAKWVVDDENEPMSVGPDDYRIVAIEAVQRALLHGALKNCSSRRFAQSLKVNGHA